MALQVANQLKRVNGGKSMISVFSQYGWIKGTCVISVPCMAIIFSACTRRDDRAATPSGTATTTENTTGASTALTASGISENSLTTIERISENPAALYGQTVIVSGEIEDVYGSRAFRLGGREFFEDEVLVITSKPVPAVTERTADKPFAQNDIALVVGTVRSMVIADIERDIGYDFGADVEANFKDKAVLVATNVYVTPRRPGAAAGTTN